MITIPRYLRPHSFTVIVKGEEDEKGVAEKKEVCVKYVKIDTSYGLKQSLKGLGKTDSIQILLDLSDFVAYEEGFKISYKDAGINKGNIIMINDEKFTITNIIETKPFSNNPLFVEVYANG